LRNTGATMPQEPKKFSILNVLKRKEESERGAQAVSATLENDVPRFAPASTNIPAQGADFKGFARVQSQTSSDAQGIDIREYWRIVCRHKGIMLFVIILSTLSALVINYLRPDYYEAVASIRLTGTAVPGFVQNRIDRLLVGSSKIQSPEMLQQLLQLKEVRAKIEDTTHELAQDWAARKEIPVEAADKIMKLTGDQIVASVQLEIPERGIITKIRSVGREKYILCPLVNGVMAGLIRHTISRSAEEAKALEKVIRSRIHKKRGEIQALEKGLQGTGDSAGRRELPQNIANALRSLSIHQQQYEKLSFDLDRVDATLNVLKKRAKDAPATTAAVIPMKDQEKLANLELKKKLLLVDYTIKNRKVINVQNEIDTLRSHIEDLMRRKTADAARFPSPQETALAKRIERLGLERKVIIAQQEKLNALIAGLKRKMKPFQARAALEIYKIDKRILETSMQELKRSLEEARIKAETMNPGIDKNTMAKNPVKLSSNPDRTIVLSLIMGMGIALFVAFLLEHLDDTIRSPYEVYKEFGLPTLGLIPYLGKPDKEKKSKLLINPKAPKSTLAEIFSLLRNNVRYSAKNNPQKMVLIASAMPNEGKSFIAANLAIAYALEGNKVLIIDGDLRKPEIHKILDLMHAEEEAPCPGLAGYLEDDESLEKTIIPSNVIDDLFVMPAGRRVHNPAKLLASEKVTDLLHRLDEQFDVIILDMPAILPVVDATVVSGRSRSVLLVLQADSTPKEAVQEAISRLEHVGSPLAGLVLNGIKGKRSAYYYGYHPGYYYSRYSYGYGYGYGNIEEA